MTASAATDPAPDVGPAPARVTTGNSRHDTPRPGVSSLDATLAALADPVRRRVVDLLAAAPRRSGELATEVGVSPATMSKHLRILRTSGLVTDTHPDFDTRVRIYSLASAPMSELRQWLAATEQGWTEQLTAFAAHLGDDPDRGSAEASTTGDTDSGSAETSGG